jgi:hypothetical protein
MDRVGVEPTTCSSETWSKGPRAAEEEDKMCMLVETTQTSDIPVME